MHGLPLAQVTLSPWPTAALIRIRRVGQPSEDKLPAGTGNATSPCSAMSVEP
jgi:hypothetical protein